MKRILIVFVGFVFVATVLAQDFDSVIYCKRDTQELGMDIFVPETDSAKLPLLIYVHGGGFSAGKRQKSRDFCKQMSERGMVVATISYRLYMKGKSFSCDGILSEKVKAIQMAVNDLRSATNYLLEHAEEYKIDPENIFIAGSSAGAETVLHAAYWPNHTMNMEEPVLDSTFRYAGVISCAGAFMDLNLINKESMIPTQMFHGTCDKLVPYGTAAHHFCPCDAPGWLMFFGAKPIAEKLETLGGVFELYSYRGDSHRIAGYPLGTRQDEMAAFIFKSIRGEMFQNHIVIPSNNVSCEEIYYVKF